MEPHQQRVVDEKRELDERRLKLNQFLKSDKTDNVPLAEILRMERQETYMALYSVVLGERINAFTVPAAAPARTVAG
jgi:hypothetical protein